MALLLTSINGKHFNYPFCSHLSGITSYKGKHMLNKALINNGDVLLTSINLNKAFINTLITHFAATYSKVGTLRINVNKCIIRSL